MPKARYALGQTPGTKPKSKRTFGAIIKPPAPPAAPTPMPVPQPVDPGYDQQISGLQRRRDDTLAGLGGQQASTLQNYGYNATFNGAGGVTGLSIDPNNPFSESARLLKHYQQSKSATTNGMAARGQLYSGALQQAQDANDVGYQQNEDSLQKRLISALAGITSQKRAAQTDYELGAGDASAAKLARAAESPLYSPTPTAVPAASEPKFTARAGTDSKGNKGVWHIYPDRKPVFIKKG